MTIQLTDDQLQALHSSPGSLPLVVDPQTQQSYVLVPENAYSKIKTLLSEDLSDAYTAQIESAMEAGWSDPLMDDYNDYDRRRAP